VNCGAHRGTIAIEDAEVLSQEAWPGGQYVLRLRAPRCAARAMPGSFAHLSCGAGIPMRRPLSIMRADPATGTIEILYKVVGQGLAALAAHRPGDAVSCLGPIGRGFVPVASRPRCLLIGGGVGIPPMIFLAESLIRDRSAGWQPLVLMGSELPFPFQVRSPAMPVPGIHEMATGAMPLLESLGVPSRLASRSDLAGCYSGYVTELAAEWLASLDTASRREVAVYACGPTPMLRACAMLARRFDVPCLVSLEEFMACGVGGCAGCAVAVETPEGPAMKRVCVDGPVFQADAVFPAAVQS
jgi:dihydroorotate dehydrogenase electron transfer subunit